MGVDARIDVVEPERVAELVREDFQIETGLPVGVQLDGPRIGADRGLSAAIPQGRQAGFSGNGKQKRDLLAT